MSPKPYPLYGTRPEKPGLYLALFHGRHTPNEHMEDWGFPGPLIGPLNWVHTTYGCQLNIEFVNSADALRYFGDSIGMAELTAMNGLIEFGGDYFGDWTVYLVKEEDCAVAPDSFRPNATRPNMGDFVHRLT
jgi:hypothetical protein